MIKLAILGSENSHCWNFASVLAPLDGKKMFEDVELIGVFGEPGEPGVEEGNKAVLEKSTCTVIAEDKDAFLEEADAVMVTARDGGKHLRYAENYIKKGIPVWIDKPITRSVEEVLKLTELADKHSAVLSGGSSLVFDERVKKLAKIAEEKKDELVGGHVTAPINMDNPYGGFWFYTQHLVSMITTVFGIEMKSVRALKTQQGVHALYKYENFTVSAFFGTGYSVSVYTDPYGMQAEAFYLPEDFFVPEIEAFYSVIKTGKPDKSRREYVAPIYILEATEKAYESGEEIDIDIPLFRD